MSKNQSPKASMIMMLAGMTEIPEIINMIKSAITDYEIEKSEKSLNKLEAACAFLMTKQAVDFRGGGFEGAIKAAQEFDSMQEKLNIFKPNNN